MPQSLFAAVQKSRRAILRRDGDTRSAPLMRGNLEVGGGGERGGRMLLGRVGVAPSSLGLLCSVWDEAESLNKQSRKEQYTRLQPWGKGELQRGRDFDM